MLLTITLLILKFNLSIVTVCMIHVFLLLHLLWLAKFSPTKKRKFTISA